tara:strand:+ start:2629 stop:3306 length:678 start_codon:yes stop_codon:yes gene_type:complete
MIWRHLVKDNFLNEKHFNNLKNIKFDTKPDEWNIHKYRIYKNGEIEIGVQNSTSNWPLKSMLKDPRYKTDPNFVKEITELYYKGVYPLSEKTVWREDLSPLTKEDIKDIHNTYHNQMWQWLTELAPEKLHLYKYTELRITNTGKDYIYPLHTENKINLLSGIVYISPKKNTGTFLYDDISGTNPQQVEWKPNRFIGFSRNDSTWHSYEADGINNRLTLVYNLRAE